MPDRTVNEFLPLTLSPADRLRRALEFIDIIEQRIDEETFTELWEIALENLKHKYCEECGVGLFLGAVSHTCLIATCPNQKRLILPG